jgi:hypothetical protein
MGINEDVGFFTREGRIYSLPEPEPKHEEKDGNKFRLLVLGLLVCVFAAICNGG